MTTLIAAALLFVLASGPVKGFGVTLGIGVLASMVSALVITRVLAEFAVARRRVHRRPGVTGLASVGRVRAWLTRRDPQLMRRPRRWLAVSAVVLAVAAAGIVVRGLNFGVEFTGGLTDRVRHRGDRRPGPGPCRARRRRFPAGRRAVVR